VLKKGERLEKIGVVVIPAGCPRITGLYVNGKREKRFRQNMNPNEKTYV
jgi:hypothetical protein